MALHYDLVVIGSGPAGEKGAAQAAYFGKKVALIERLPYLGGAGINTGTVPSKTLRETALYFSGLRQRGLFGIDYSLRENLTVADFLHRPKEELYDLTSDPNELHNLAADPAHKATLEELRGKLAAWRKQTADPWLIKDRHE